jgi:hypothetical protein
MWGARYLTTLWASTACYRDNFNFTLQDTDMLVEIIRNISKMRQEEISLKKAVRDKKNPIIQQNLVAHWCSTLTSSWEIMKPYFFRNVQK